MKLNHFAFLVSLLALTLLSGFTTNSGKNRISGSYDVPYHINWPDFLNHSQKITKLSSFASGISYVKLETPDTVKMGMVRKLNLTNENIFILDQTSSIFRFDNSGKFKNKISHVGRGPGEYTNMSGFTVDQKNNLIALLNGRKAMFYNFSGSFIKEIEIKGSPVQIEWIAGDMYLVMMHVAVLPENDPMPLSSVVIDINGKILEQHRYFENEKRSESATIAWKSRISLTEGGVLINEIFNDTIFIVRKDALRIPYIINKFGTYRAPREYLEGPDYSPKLDTKYILNAVSYIFPGYAFVSFVFKNQPYKGIWDFKKNIAFSLQNQDAGPGFRDDIDSGLPFISSRDSRDQLIDIIEPVKLLSDKSLKPRQGSQLAEIMKALRIDDNPVIRILKTRDEIKAEE